MNNDKKKILILGALGLVLVAVGAFSFMGGGSGGGSVVASTQTDKAQKSGSADTAESGAANGSGTESGQAGKPLPAAGGTTEGAGTNTGSATGDQGAATGENATGATPENPGVLSATPFVPRDPFLVPSTYAMNVPAPPPAQTPPPKNPKVEAPVRPGTNSGYQPMDPMRGSLPAPGQSGPAGAPMVAKPMYRVKGILLGAKPMAVFEDSSGNQKLVPLGGSVDGDTKVVAIEKGKVRVSQKGKEHTLTIDEEARND